jgi:hypothetical protein
MAHAVVYGQQQPTEQKLKLGPAKLMPQPLILDESVVTLEWPNTLPKVNIPPTVSDLSPGQCIRVGVVASGDDSAGFLGHPEIAFTIHFGGAEAVLPMEVSTVVKLIKPEGADFVQDALAAAAVKFEVPTSAAVAASPQKWCVPADAQPGQVNIETTVLIGGKRTSLKTVSLSVLSPEKPGRSPIADEKAMEAWMQTYYRHPQPEFLLAILPSIFKYDQAAKSTQQFVISAMKRDPAVVARLGTQLGKAEPMVQALAVKLAAEAGVEMKISFELSPMQKEFVEKLPNVPDAFHPVADVHIGEMQDMLWSMFMATGDRAPIDSIIGMLGWRDDYDAFRKMQTEHQKMTEVTPSIAHAVAYAAAGWSIGSFQRSDPLVADYIAATLADSRTPDNIKSELRALATNPAFKRQK